MGAAPGTTEPDYPVTDATRTSVFGDDGSLTVTCVFDVANGQYVLDRGDAMDCETYGTLVKIHQSVSQLIDPKINE